ncbi:intercellular adhesion molecule 5-like [Elgaria multicarinata webbii]|uniref:intercellular adhesion molecule 5-like n=1 Tax=Elgaria multicarinata webbii TaxID=159646 RepID=UPI002FCCD04E
MQSFLAFLLLHLLVSGTWAGTKEAKFIRIWPEKAVVEYGGSIVLNCSSNCEGIRLESNLNKISAGNGTSWKAFNLTSVNDWEPESLCFAPSCSSVAPPRTKITVYSTPEFVVLDPVPKMEVGKEYTLTCQVSRVAPIRNLTVTLLKGQETLLVKTFENHINVKADDVIVTHNMTAQRADHGERITCHTALDLRPEGPLFEKTSSSQSLKNVVFPVDPSLKTLPSIETNTEMTVTCDASGVFPAEEAQFVVWFAEERRNFSRSVSGDTVSAQALVSTSSAGEHKLICTVSLGPVTRTVEKRVDVYSLPKPILNVDPQRSLVNESVVINCSLDGTESPGIEMQIRDAKGILATGSPPFLMFPVKTCEEDDGREFICRVELTVDDRPVVKETSVNLIVFYGPWMNDSSCPGMLTWQEGSEETFTCSAWGNPLPMVECKKGDKVYNTGVKQLVNGGHHGIYHCIATNGFGSDVRNVTIHVEPSQLNILAIILPTLVAVIGLVAAVSYYMYYRSYKIGEYRLRKQQQQQQRQQEAGCPMEQKCLNGNAHNETV